MKRLITAIAAAGLLLLPTALLAETQTGGSEPPPISQTLVREGDFAFDLAPVLELGEPATEAEAEDALASVGITPKNGWIADYPVTPDILAELEDAIREAAFLGKLTLGTDDALKAFRGLALDYGLPIKPAEDQNYAEESGELEYGDYSSEQVGEGEDYYEPNVIEEYYVANEPPVITYYSPPWDYFYLYSWVPYPFWWYGYYYPGYYVLNDFTVVVNHHHHHRHHKWHRDRDWSKSGKETTAFVSNHVKDPGTGEYARLDPATRKPVRYERRERGAIDRQRARTSFKDVKAAESIAGREFTRSGRRAQRDEARAAEKQTRQFDRAVRHSDKAQAREDRRQFKAQRKTDRQIERATRLGDRAQAREDRRQFKAERKTERQIERATRLGDRAQAREDRRQFKADRQFERATRIGSRPERNVNREAIRSERGAARQFERATSPGGNMPSRQVERSFSAPSRGGGSVGRPSAGNNRSFGVSRPGSRGGGFSNACRGGRC